MGAAREGAGDQGAGAGADGEVTPGADGQPGVGLRQGGRVVDAVADQGDHASFGLQPNDLGELLRGQHSCDDVVDAEIVDDEGK